jgi:hypothetical protein
MVQIIEFNLQQIPVTQVAVGETWRVYVSFKYTAPQDMTITLQASPFTRILGVLNRVESCRGTTQVSLPASLTPLAKEEYVDIYFIPKDEGGIDNGTYGLIAEIPGTDAWAAIDDCIIVSGNPAGIDISSMLSMVMVMMMMGMMMPMMEGE